MKAANSSSLLRPKFVALDTSHLGAVARDMFSKDKTRQKRAQAFQRSFDDTGNVLLLCWHHVQELLSHENDVVRSQRMEFIKSLPMAAGLNSYSGLLNAGSITDILCFEVSIAFRRPTASVSAIRDEAAKAMFRLGSGAELIQSMDEARRLLQPMFVEREQRDREIVAITKSDFSGNSQMKMVDLLKAPARSPDEIEHQLRHLREKLIKDIAERGDKRILDPEAVATAFIEDVRRRGMAAMVAGNVGENILLGEGIDISEIGPETTMADVGAMGVFRKKLAVLNKTLGLPWSELKACVKEDRLPSEIIQAAIAKYHPDTRVWDGSELTDRHLACLSAYADVTYVDKRTHEAFRQARQKLNGFAAITRRVEKAGNYEEIATYFNSV